MENRTICSRCIYDDRLPGISFDADFREKHWDLGTWVVASGRPWDHLEVRAESCAEDSQGARSIRSSLAVVGAVVVADRRYQELQEPRHRLATN